MAFVVKDKKLDDELNKIVSKLRNEFGISNASKADAIRFLLQMRQQGKKTHPKWRDLF